MKFQTEKLIYIDMANLGVSADKWETFHQAVELWLEAGPYGMPSKGFGHTFTFDFLFFTNDNGDLIFNDEDYGDDYKPLTDIMIVKFGLEKVLTHKFIINIDW